MPIPIPHSSKWEFVGASQTDAALRSGRERLTLVARQGIPASELATSLFFLLARRVFPLPMPLPLQTYADQLASWLAWRSALKGWPRNRVRSRGKDTTSGTNSTVPPQTSGGRCADSRTAVVPPFSVNPIQKRILKLRLATINCHVMVAGTLVC